MLQKIKNLLRIGRKKSTVDNITIEAEYMGKTQKAVLYVPYGMQINPKNKNFTLLFQQNGNEESLWAFCTDMQDREELEDEEVSIGIPTLKSRIKFNKNDEIELYTEKSLKYEDGNENKITTDSAGVIIECLNGNTITMAATGIKLEDLNGNVVDMGPAGVNINNGNLEVGL